MEKWAGQSRGRNRKEEMKVGMVRAQGLRCGKARWVDREVGRLEES